MKKISLVLLSVFTLVFGSMLTACNFKDVKATFSQEEVVMSLNEQIDLKDFLTVDQLKTSEVDFKFSNPSLFEYENLKITAVASGISNVYATYKNNSLASMRIVVKKQFDAPKNFEVNDNVLQWNVPIGFIENDLTPTKPTSYLVEGECKIFSPTDPEEIVKVVQINQTLNTNSFELTDGGQYTLQITANANGYFDASEKSAEFVYYHDYMPKLTVEDLTWSNTGLLSWNYSEVNEAKFKIKMDGVILGDFTSETSKNLKTYFDNAESGEHSLSVLVYDINEKKLVQESEIIKVVKLSEPVVKQVDGQLEISTDSKATKYNVILNNGQQNMLLENSQNKIVTSLEGLASGIYTAQIYAMSENGNFYQSDIVDIGKIYKLPKVTISGVGNNLENGNILNVQAEVTESLIDTSFKLYGLGETLIVDGMTAGETVCNFEVSLTDPLSTLKLIATAKQSQNQIDGENTWVLNSDFSNSLSLTKVDAFTQEIVHNYEEEVSVLSFQKVENATNYLLFVNEASGYQPFTQASLDLDQAKFIFEDKIENLVEPVILDGRKIFDFKIVATIEDDKLAINSSITKQINLLEAPISAGSGNSTDLSYTWGAVENADGYNIEIYQISKQEYEDNKSTINLNKTGAEPEFVDTNHYNFESEGYYYVKIFAVSKDENMAISSQDCLKEVFYISKQLVIGNINFGYNNSYTTYPEFSDAKGYFIRMDKVDNVDGFEVVLTGGNATIFTVDNGDYCDILLAEDFSGTQEIEITVKGNSNDDTIYLDSNLQTLTIKKLPKVTFADLQFDDQMQNVSLNPAQFEGVSRIVMRDELNDDSVDVEGAIAVMPITNKTNFSLTIKLYGTKKTGDLYNQGNIIYLDGADSVLKIDRIDTPEQMIYQNSDLVITHNQNAISNTEYYLLNVICTTVSGEEKFVIQLGKTSTTAKIIYQSQTVEIGNSQDYISFVDNNVTIKLADLIEILKQNPLLSGYYAQSISLDFEVVAFLKRIESDRMLVSSLPCSLKNKIEKIASPVVSITQNNRNFSLNWEEVNTTLGTDISAETTYEVFTKLNENFEKLGEVKGATTYDLGADFDTSVYYEYYIKATNPYYLESGDSNIVRIYLLQSLNTLTLTEDGKLQYNLPSSEKDFVAEVKYSINDGPEQVASENTIDITQTGNYSFKLYGKTITETNISTYYIDSNPSVWTVDLMSSLKPEDETITYLNNKLSFQPFGQDKGLTSLVYILFFKDVNGEVKLYSTNSTEVDLKNNFDAFDIIDKLNAGDITVTVSAYLNSYSTAVGQTIYYAPEVTLENNSLEHNYYIYQSNLTIFKKTAPVITNIEFLYDNQEDSDYYLTDAQTPKIKVSFTGNYVVGDEYSVFVADGSAPILNGIITESGENSFELSKEIYNNGFNAGDSLKISISVSGQNAIPSSRGSQEIYRALNVGRVELEENDTFTHNLNVTFDTTDTRYFVGGLILKIEINQTTTIYKKVDITGVDENNNSVTYDLSQIFEENLLDGGQIKFSAFINSYSNAESKAYYLASPVLCVSQNYNVLRSVTSLTRKEGGFVIDSTLNNQTTTYVVSYGEESYEVDFNNGEFYFEIPDHWTDKEYNITIFAKEDGYVNSVVNNLNFSVNRITSVDVVSMQRKQDNLKEITFVWGQNNAGSIEAISDATGYIIRVYNKETQTILTESTLATNTATLVDIFGENYQKLLDAGLSSVDFEDDFELMFEIITKGNSSLNNSYAYSFEVTISGNELLKNLNVNDCIFVDEYGMINFETTIGKNYIYRFVNAQGAQLKQWQQIEATDETISIDASELIIEADIPYEVEIITLGSATTEQNTFSSDFKFTLDSYYITTLRQDLTFKMNQGVTSVGYVQDLPSSFAFAMNENALDNPNSKIYAGLEENALIKKQVISFMPEKTEVVANASQVYYTFSPLALIDLFVEAGYSLTEEEVTVYFWTYKVTEEQSSSYTISKPYEFTFVISADNYFKELKKMGVNDGENPNYSNLEFAEGYEDFVNTFAVFENNDDSSGSITLGIYIKITGVDEGQEISKFVSKLQLQNSQYFDQTVYVVNLTSIFEEENLTNAVGNYKIEFARVEYANGMFKIANWLSQDKTGKEFVFERLSPIENLKISAGNLLWQDAINQGAKYYVYFAEDVDVKNHYSYYPTIKTLFEASSYMAELDKYYIAVQAISEDEFVIASTKTFILDDEGEKKQVIKNRIANKLILTDGKLAIEMNDGDDFVSSLNNSLMSNAEIAELLCNKTFTSPITFTINDLLNNNLMVRLKFTKLDGSEGLSDYFDVNAKYLLSNLKNYVDRIKEIYNDAPTADNVKETLGNLIEYIEQSSNGIANSSILFDELFERLQLGGYKLEYSLLGNNYSLASGWYTFENDNLENVLYVNAEPQVKAIAVNSNDLSLNSYKLLIKKGQIYNYVDGEYVTTIAENYVVKLHGSTEWVFEITKGVNQYSLTLKGDTQGNRSVSVYTTDMNGEVNAGGDYLMFYLNHNNGDSILGQYTLVKETYSMQVYAVGSNVSTSSKSEVFNLVLLGFGQNIKLVNGTFIWTAQINRQTSVIFKRSTSQKEEEIGVSGDGIYSTFSLENVGAGKCLYLKFVMKGEVKENNIYIDSEVYQIDNVYKLNAPSLSNFVGEIQIDDSTNATWLNECFVKENESLYNYEIYNDVSSNALTYTFSNTNGTSKVNYQVGTTELETDNPSYEYKSTEELAKMFYVSSLGTTATLSAVRDVNNYYIYKLYCVEQEATQDTEQLLSSKSIALRSEYSALDAQMLSTPENLRVEDGVLKWDEVLGKNDLTIPETNNVKTVYKISVVQYKISNTEDGTVDTNVGEVYSYYTTNVHFDFANITKDQIIEMPEKTYLKAIVQALALYTTNSNLANSVSLIEGGYAHGDISYKDTTTKVLKSNGNILSKIDRLESIDENSLKATEGRLTWTYTTDSSVTEQTFFDKYDFVVYDNSGKEVTGSCEASLLNSEDDKNIFFITFKEDKNAMQVGENELFVYAIQGKNNEDVVIKSFGRSIVVNKLKTVDQADYIIDSYETYEVLNFESYFAQEENRLNIIYPTLTLNGEEQTVNYVFTADVNKMYIYYSQPDNVSYPAGYIKNYLVISNTDVAKFNFEIKKAVPDSITIFSDISDDIVLQRASLENNTIEWDETKQIFTWQYDGNYSFEQEVEAELVEKSYLTNKNAILYSDDLMMEQANTIANGTEIEIVEVLSSSTKIMLEGQEYFIANKDYQEQYVTRSQEILPAGTLYKLVESQTNNAIVFANEKYYKVVEGLVQKPIYIIEAIYGDSPFEIKRIYTTTDNYFEPTIIGKVTISVRIKLGEKNLQSQILQYAEIVIDPQTKEETVKILQEDFNLFASGDGTKANPYIIENEEQFLNIEHRMIKADYLKSYLSADSRTEESDVFNFKINNDTSTDSDDILNLGSFEGIIFKGDFDGVLDANGVTISYVSNGVSRLNNSITVTEGWVLSSTTASSTTFNYGSALFERLLSTANISNMKLDVIFGNYDQQEQGYVGVAVSKDSLISPLVVQNFGNITNIELVGYSNYFYGFYASDRRIMMAYSGIASINEGANAYISNCKVSTNMTIFDSSRSQVMFLSGIVYVNYSRIENCEIGNVDLMVSCEAVSNTIQASGIATTNTSVATINNCKNNAAIYVYGAQPKETNLTDVYMSGIANWGMGALTNNTTQGLNALITADILDSQLKKGAQSISRL